MTAKELMGTGDVAQRLGATRSTVNRLVNAGHIPIIGVIGKRRIRVFDRAEIERIAMEEK